MSSRFFKSAAALLSLAALLLQGLPATASGGPELHPTLKALVEFETRVNGAARRNPNPIQIRHFEIPLDALQSDVADRLSSTVRDSVIIEKKGRKYVRWIINPEDTEFHTQVEKWLEKRNLSTKRHTHFQAYMTASRSYILVDPTNGAQFSAKVSTNRTGGSWQNKKQTIGDARETRMAADYVREGLARAPLKNAVILDEPAMFGISVLDQAMVLRNLDALFVGPPEGRKLTYIPGFTALHEKMGPLIASANGGRDPSVFWNEHYNKPLARALAEYTARFGLTYDSPHSQNFLIELDQGMRPTGRIVLRDIGDAFAATNFFTAQGKLGFLQKWEPKNVLTGRIHMTVGLLQGGVAPFWLGNEEYNRWGIEFFEEYEREIAKLTGVPDELLKGDVMRSGRYFMKDYPLMNEPWREYMKRTFRKIPKCAEYFLGFGA